MRTAGNYKSALHKLNHALKLDPTNETGKFEYELLNKIIKLDSEISLDKMAKLKFI